MTRMATIRIELLGRAQVLFPEPPPINLEGKMAALVTYLALEGATQRERLAGLLWPTSPQENARGNLRQMLHRLKEKLKKRGGDVVEGEDPVRLCDGLSIDVVLLRKSCLAKDYAQLPAFSGELLAGFAFDDCAELNEWLRSQRFYFHQLMVRAAEDQALQLEKEGKFGVAMDEARRLLNLEPSSEEGWRLVMRLHQQQGDGPSAVNAYRACQEVLKEMGLQPSPATQELAQLIEHQSLLGRPRPTAFEVGRVPVIVSSPQELVGRHGEWALLEEAWARNQPVYVFGDAGIGKTRLVTEFCGAQGEFLLVPTMPSDVSFPYATCARMIQVILVQVTSAHSLERSVRQELSRLVPMSGHEALSPPTTSEEKLRFSVAFSQLISLLGHEMPAMIFDNAHNCDPASFELFLRAQDLLAQRAPATMPRIMTCFRTLEMPGQFADLLHRYVESGLARRIQLGPLPPDMMAPLLEGMKVDGLVSLAEDMVRYTGGNPLFVMETVKSLVETQNVSKLGLTYLPPPIRLVLILEQHFRRLSPDALRLARIIAIAGTAFRPKHASRILGLSLEQLATPWKELERSGLLSGTSFTSGLARGLVVETMPPDVRDGVVQWILHLLRQER